MTSPGKATYCILSSFLIFAASPVCAEDQGEVAPVPVPNRLLDLSKCQVVVRRLGPGKDLRKELQELCRTEGIAAGVILSLVGSLRVGKLRFAGEEKGSEIKGPLEIVSVTGTVASSGLHVHIAVSNSRGETIGGHLLDGCKVYTTAEMAILNLSSQWKFERVIDEETGYPELRESRIDTQSKIPASK